MYFSIYLIQYTAEINDEWGNEKANTEQGQREREAKEKERNRRKGKKEKEGNKKKFI